MVDFWQSARSCVSLVSLAVSESDCRQDTSDLFFHSVDEQTSASFTRSAKRYAQEDKRMGRHV